MSNTILILFYKSKQRSICLKQSYLKLVSPNSRCVQLKNSIFLLQVKGKTLLPLPPGSEMIPDFQESNDQEDGEAITK